MKEIWKDIKGYEDLYQISSLGTVKSLDRRVKTAWGTRAIKGKIISKNLNASGYPCVCLCKNGGQKTTPMHRLVALHFIENIYDKPFVNHIDGNKLNHSINNLEWCTPKENYDHSVRTGLQGYADKPIVQLDLDGNFIKEYKSGQQAQDLTGICRKQISNCIKGKQATCHGFIWKFKNN